MHSVNFENRNRDVRTSGDGTPPSVSIVDRLPDELWISILRYLPVADLLSTRETNHHFQQLSSDPSLWKILCASTPFGSIPIPENEHPMETYTRRTTGVWQSTLLEGHTDSVDCLQTFGEKLLSGSVDKTIRLWDLDAGTSKVFEGHTDWVTCLQPFGDRFLSGSVDKTIRLWDPDTRTSQVFKGHTDWVRCLQVVGERIVSISFTDNIWLWQLVRKDLHGEQDLSVAQLLR